ncbi:MAG: aldo/keto reductase, partial [Clostridium sp.]
MKKIFLGNSTLSVSNIGLGGINFGTKTSENQSFKLMDSYFKVGGNFIDTANNYAVWN